jgi:chromosome segregation ATPase
MQSLTSYYLIKIQNKMKKNLFIALAAFLLVATSSCKRTVEGENNRWNANKQEVEEMRAKYSNFEAALDEIMEKAEAKMNEAESASSEDASIKLMTAANSIITSSFVPKLKKFDSKVNDIEDLAAKAAQIPGDHSDNDAAWTAKNSADRAIRDARKSLNSAQINNLSAAESIVNSAMQNLDRAKSRLNNVISKAKEKQEAKEKAEEDKKAAENAAKTEEKKKAQPVKCSYCGKNNDPGSKECGGCGAPVEG